MLNSIFIRFYGKYIVRRGGQIYITQIKFLPILFPTGQKNGLNKFLIISSDLTAQLQGFKKAIVIATELRQSTEILENDNFKEIGSIDEDFVHLKHGYRTISL